MVPCDGPTLPSRAEPNPEDAPIAANEQSRLARRRAEASPCDQQQQEHAEQSRQPTKRRGDEHETPDHGEWHRTDSKPANDRQDDLIAIEPDTAPIAG